MRKIISVIVIVLAILLLTETAAARGADGYNYDHTEWELTTVEITIEWVDSHRQLERMAEARGAALEKGNHAASFAVLNPEAGKCTIYAIALEVDYRPELIGHEVIHCFRGRFHKENMRYTHNR